MATVNIARTNKSYEFLGEIDSPRFTKYDRQSIIYDGSPTIFYGIDSSKPFPEQIPTIVPGKSAFLVKEYNKTGTRIARVFGVVVTRLMEFKLTNDTDLRLYFNYELIANDNDEGPSTFAPEIPLTPSRIFFRRGNIFLFYEGDTDAIHRILRRYKNFVHTEKLYHSYCMGIMSKVLDADQAIDRPRIPVGFILIGTSLQVPNMRQLKEDAAYAAAYFDFPSLVDLIKDPSEVVK